MAGTTDKSDESLSIAQRWCEGKGAGWSISAALGTGGTAPVFEVNCPDGVRALKIYDARFSAGKKGEIEQKRIDQQLALKGHDCPFLVQVYEGGRFEGRLYLVMSRAPGTELEKRLSDIPRDKIRQILDQVARAALYLKGKGLCHRDIKAANVFISDDFNHCTLLDISVIRDITDPVGVGTDHGGQLPVVATARYSPPEYLFRLVEPGPELWHALNVYQLGALLYDLIMREPLFQAEYLKSSENRYRFAWIIATTEPPLQADDVDRDLMLMALRALDKKWQRRSALKLEDFLADANVRQTHALQVLGLGIPPAGVLEVGNVTGAIQRVREVASDLERRAVQHLRDQGVIAIHEVHPGADDRSKVISLRWDTPAPGAQHAELQLGVCLVSNSQGDRFELSARLTTQSSEGSRAVAITLPELRDDPSIELNLFNRSVEAFERLAVELSSANVALVEE